ncbi:MAG TPA: CYTH domain-containing protein [Candidatus Paceibacterota bacterium]|jgi:predicted adenylyl cyclase CyaB|nr:CYTH domain-containing protein [Candidatus Paceibacterota bacterium]
MAGSSYEIEIKSLLGGPENAERLRTEMKKLDSSLKKVSTHTQLNHYFEGKGDFTAVAKAIPDAAQQKAFVDLANKAKDFSLRTRDADGKVFLVLKASIDDTTSANGTARQELSEEIPVSLDALDAAILSAGFSYQAKWSRAREEYEFLGANVTIDKNAGYGYLAEFEIIENDPSRADATKAKLRDIMQKLGVKELNQDRLARMFAFYNLHWQEYYGTENIFVIE